VEAGILILVVIAGVWAAFLLPPLFFVRRETPLNTTQEFTKLTSRLASVQESNGPARLPASIDRTQVLTRRRQILIAMFVTVVATLAAAIVRGSFPLLLVHLAADAALAWYVMMLLQIKERQAAAAVMITPPLPVSEGPVRIVASR